MLKELKELFEIENNEKALEAAKKYRDANHYKKTPEKVKFAEALNKTLEGSPYFIESLYIKSEDGENKIISDKKDVKYSAYCLHSLGAQEIIINFEKNNDELVPMEAYSWREKKNLLKKQEFKKRRQLLENNAELLEKQWSEACSKAMDEAYGN